MPEQPVDESAADQIDIPLRTIVGKAAPVLEKARGLRTVGELLDWLPRTYLDPSRPTAFDMLPENEDIVAVGTVTAVKVMKMRNRPGRRLVADVADDSGGILQLTFFKAYGHQERLKVGTKIVCSGTITRFGHQLQLTHPAYTPLGDGTTSGHWLLDGLLPVYTATKGLSPIVHGDSLDLVLRHLQELPDPIPEHVRRAMGLPSLLEAYRLVHRPGTETDHQRGRWRLTFQEAFVVQSQLARSRRSSGAVPALPRVARADGLPDLLRRRLPYTLTQGQEQVLVELLDDLASQVPMHRLLQGEVGSGKTVLALLAMLTVVDAGGQAALLAPTEVLAAQHHRSMTQMLGPLAQAGMLGGAQDGTRVTLLTGSQPAAERREALLEAASGAAGLVIGTHALIQKHVQFADLGLVVVDEQHRFGVEQRDALRVKAPAGTAPHLLVMTATPIPRTVAMTVFGDIEISTLRELPHGRQPISSFVVEGERDSWVRRTWERVAEEVRGGGQAYVVCPRIGETDDPDLPGAADPGPGLPIPAPEQRGGLSGEDGADLLTLEASTQEANRPLHGVHQVARSLRRLPATRELRIEVLHGRMSAEDKDAVMQAYAAGRIDLLVSTTVIEVGVDVPDATTMVVLDADRFGISQLHQLRGRVGRGGRAGLCLLMTQSTDPEGLTRLERVADTSDGFELAQLDLETRHEGDVLGASQSGGRSGLRFLRLARDEKLILQAHEAAWSTVENDPELEKHPALAAELDRLDAIRAAFLERG